MNHELSILAGTVAGEWSRREAGTYFSGHFFLFGEHVFSRMNYFFVVENLSIAYLHIVRIV